MGLSKNKTNLTTENSPKLEKEELPSEKEELSSKEDILKKILGTGFFYHYLYRHFFVTVR